ncbi:MAG: alcohol dehydrogenase catalytic domain-containing protein [Spirochaetaceae bacterium]|nr:alcohol dehydrogenase catalytic domain-containing protein [Spirochaetaceae bacterium]MDT8297516.1 alcohol dehydrogenase catalytic domain-containing protein [Spirochaetaceae bacterium]
MIRIHTAGVTAADNMMRAGKPKYGRLFLGLRGPKHKTPGTGFAGIVEAVGPEVTRFAEGDELFGEIVF